ncbi:MAG: sugar O-acetyltransferase [Jaaginema sp. PMC 1079.18]|nr:sugar O-acetyltransferase [Jaaginema sp. PMC 1080.18]MEC4853580.1 sugar O-acetyltransferase [Jaaginema sp. PMC 1079.18]MEC4868086.1 sugar O-acetyltransferase [Jaaginema sp. PMC 1078.18]
MSDSQKERMLRGELYDPLDPQLCAERRQARLLFQALNCTTENQEQERKRLLKELIPAAGTNLWIELPFYCDYGSNITLGDRVYFNFNCVILDVAPVTIGSDTMLGPGVHIYTVAHPVAIAERRSNLEFGKPVTIGNEVWIGGGAIICPGVRIGDRSVIGAGSVVVKDIPADVVAVGNPCRVIRSL